MQLPSIGGADVGELGLRGLPLPSGAGVGRGTDAPPLQCSSTPGPQASLPFHLSLAICFVWNICKDIFWYYANDIVLQRKKRQETVASHLDSRSKVSSQC